MALNDEVAEEVEISESKGTWAHAAFHVATTIATPAAYAPLPFAIASLGWPLGVSSLVAGTLSTWYSSLLIASLWRWDGNKHTTYRYLAKSIYGWDYYCIYFFSNQVLDWLSDLLLKDLGVTGLLHFFSRWLPLETILPSKSLPGAASRQYTNTMIQMVA